LIIYKCCKQCDLYVWTSPDVNIYIQDLLRGHPTCPAVTPQSLTNTDRYNDL